MAHRNGIGVHDFLFFIHLQGFLGVCHNGLLDSFLSNRLRMGPGNWYYSCRPLRATDGLPVKESVSYHSGSKEEGEKEKEEKEEKEIE